MAATDPLTNSSRLFDWLDGLFGRIFFQADDDLAHKTYHDLIADDAVIRLNHDRVNKSQYWESIQSIRAKNTVIEESSDEIQVWNAPDGLGGGCVGQLGRFVLKNKETGVDTKGTSLVLTNVQIRGGKRVLVELTEVIN